MSLRCVENEEKHFEFSATNQPVIHLLTGRVAVRVNLGPLLKKTMVNDFKKMST